LSNREKNFGDPCYVLLFTRRRALERKPNRTGIFFSLLYKIFPNGACISALRMTGLHRRASPGLSAGQGSTNRARAPVGVQGSFPEGRKQGLWVAKWAKFKDPERQQIQFVIVMYFFVIGHGPAAAARVRWHWQLQLPVQGRSDRGGPWKGRFFLFFSAARNSELLCARMVQQISSGQHAAPPQHLRRWEREEKMNSSKGGGGKQLRD